MDPVIESQGFTPAELAAFIKEVCHSHRTHVHKLLIDLRCCSWHFIEAGESR